MVAGSGMYGSNPDQLRALAKSATRGSTELIQLQRIISRKLEECQWRGPDAVKFRTLWDSDIAPRIHGAAESMSSVGKHLKRSADEQENVSSASTVSAGSGSSSGSGSGSGSSPSPTLQVFEARPDLQPADYGLAPAGYVASGNLSVADNLELIYPLYPVPETDRVQPILFETQPIQPDLR